MAQTSTASISSSSPGKAILILIWVLSALEAALFVSVGLPKLLSVPIMVTEFAKIGLGQWFRYFTGTLEIIGAIGLLIPKYSGYAALLLCAIMIGAIITVLKVIGGPPTLPIILLIISAFIAYFRLRTARGVRG
jgi:uncharacterized membrane protein YphA (DoxX/SURF4 family)